MTKKSLSDYPILCLVGPTASGKSALALDLAQQRNGEIINADSRQFYRGMNIGTAKPTLADRQKIPHHLLDCTDVTEPWSVARFCQEADRVIGDLQSKNKTVIVVGGTGLYIKSLLFGLDSIPAVDSPLHQQLQETLTQKGLGFLYQELERLDPDSAKALSPNDTQRIMRALGVVMQTGKSIRSYWDTGDRPARYSYDKLALDVPRDVLYQRIDARVQTMVQQGLKEEALGLIKKYPHNVVLEKTIGYAEWIGQGEQSDHQVIQKIQQNTRRFAKRQLTWFRGEKDVRWVGGDFL